MTPHPNTAAIARMIDYSRRLPEAEKARLKWLAWVHWSSRSGANFRTLKIG